MRSGRVVALLLVAAVAGVLVWAEAMQARASTRRLGTRPGTSGAGEVVVAFGLRNRGSRANPVNRSRVRAALRSRARTGPSTVLFCGGTTSAGVAPEAELMARYAVSIGADRDEIELEAESRSTWDNVRLAIPFLEGADRIVFVSDPLHAEKARAYLWRQRPDLAERLAAGEPYRPGELLLLQPVLAWVGVRALRRLDGRGIAR